MPCAVAVFLHSADRAQTCAWANPSHFTPTHRGHQPDQGHAAPVRSGRHIRLWASPPLAGGDVNWQLTTWETDGLLDAYVGLDIVPRVIQAVSARYAHHSNKRFAWWDMAACALPRLASATDESWDGAGPPDLVHTRQALQHLPRARAVQAATHLVASGAKWLVVTSHNASASAGLHSTATEGGFWHPDMSKAPFHFPPPIECLPMSTQPLECLYAFDSEAREAWLRAHGTRS